MTRFPSTRWSVSALLMVAVLPSAAAAQAFPAGGDTCATATPIAGTGVAVIENFLNTDSGFSGGGSCVGVGATMVQDQFFQWTAAEAGDYAFFFRGQPAGDFDAKIALYDGLGCAATCIGAHDDPGSVFAIMHLASLDVGDGALVRVGGRFSGSFFSTLPYMEVVQLEGDTCEYPEEIAGAGRFGFPLRFHSASGYRGGAASSCGVSAPVVEDHFYRWTAPADGDYWFDTQFSPVSTYVSIYDGGDCSALCRAAVTPSSDPSGRAQVLVPGIHAGDVLLVQIAADWDLYFSGNCDLAIYRDACASPDAFEPNNDPSTATPIVPGAYPGLAVSRETLDVDYFSFRLEPGESCYAQLTSVEGGQLYLEAAGSNGNVFDFLGLGDDEDPVFSNTRPFPQTFLLKVRSSLGIQLPCAGYDLSFDIGPDPCLNSADDAEGDNDTCATALHVDPGVLTDQFINTLDPDYFTVDVAPGETLDVGFFQPELTSGVYTALRYSCGTNPVAFGNDLGLQWTNLDPIPRTMILEVRLPLVQTYQNECLFYDLIIGGGATIGQPYCDATTANSFGTTGKIEAYGTVNAVDNQLALRGYDLPDFSLAFFIASQTQGFTAHPAGSRGDLCLGGAIARFSLQASSVRDHEFVRSVDLTSIPEPPNGGLVVMPGDTWNFQLWHRDYFQGSVTSNFTGAVSVTFQ